MRHAPNGREYEPFYGDPATLSPAGWRRVEQEEALAQPPNMDVMYVDRDQAGPSFWVVREKSDLTRMIAEAKKASNFLHHIDMTWQDPEIRADATVCGHRLYQLIVDIESKAREQGGAAVTQLGSTRVGAWFSALSRAERKTLLVLLHDLRTISEKRVDASETDQTHQFFTHQLQLVLGLLRALDDDHQTLKPPPLQPPTDG